MNSPVRITDQTWPDSTIPIVSVFNWVYNHKDFIRESIESILMQETTFPVEIIIQDDASNDGTREIIEEYQNKYPNLFNNILFSENQYSQGKSIMNGLFEKPRGKYIALTHGDDYWTDPMKLQKQVDFLEENSNCTGVYTNFDYLDDGAILEHNNPFPNKSHSDIFLVNQVWNGPFLLSQTATVVFRASVNEIVSDMLNVRTKLNLGADNFLQIALFNSGKVGYLYDVCSVYRRHKNGITSKTLYTDIREVKKLKTLLVAAENRILVDKIDFLLKYYIGRVISKNKKNWFKLLINRHISFLDFMKYRLAVLKSNTHFKQH